MTWDQAGAFQAATQEQLQAFLRDNAAGRGDVLRPAGGESDGCWELRPHLPVVKLSALGLNRVVDYPARDLTVTVEAGLRAAALQRLLAAERQQLPVDLPAPERSTLGGALAANRFGSRCYGYGTLRDYLIGVTAVDASGRCFHAGGRVVKNVAGYDLGKLLIGSQGSLAMITELTFKLRPLPEVSAWLRAGLADYSAAELALAALNRSAARPVAVDLVHDPAAASGRERAALWVGVEGAEQEVSWQLDKLRDELAAAGAAAVERPAAGEGALLFPEPVPPAAPAATTTAVQACVLPSRVTTLFAALEGSGARLHAHAGNGVIRGRLPAGAAGRQAWDGAVQAAGGNAALPWSWMRKLKDALDPRGLLYSLHFFPGARP